MAQPIVSTKILTNFSGNLIRTPNGSLDSGNVDYNDTHGLNPYQKPGTLSFLETPRSIVGAIITDLIMGMDVYTPVTDNLYVYGIGNLGRVYKIQVNDVATKNPDYDTATLFTTLKLYTVGSSTPFQEGDHITSSSGGVGVINSYNTGNGTITIEVSSGTFLAGDTITDLDQVTLTIASATGFNNGDNVTSSSGGIGTVRQVNIGTGVILVHIISGTFLVGNTITDTTTSNSSTINVRTAVTGTISAVAAPTFHYGGTIKVFAGYLIIGHDKGVMRVSVVDGTGQYEISGSWQQNVPRPMKAFLGNLYIGNSHNIAELNGSAIVTSSAKLSPSVDGGQTVIDIDVTSDGIYLVVTASSNLPSVLDMVSSNVFDGYSGNSGLYYWNGVDTGITRFTTFPAFNGSSYLTFGASEYMLGNDVLGASISTPASKLLTLPFLSNPLPNAMNSDGNMVLFMAPEYLGGYQKAALHAYGQFDAEYQSSHYRHLLKASTLTNGDVVRVNAMSVVTNILYGRSGSGYTSNVLTNGKIYFSTLEYDGTNTAYGFYAFNLYPTGIGTAIAGIYETQQELFSKKIVAKEVRIYLEPAVAGQSFTCDLIGIDGEIITDVSGLNTFTEGTIRLAAGETVAWYNPQHKPTPALGIRITNLGTVSPVIHKIEVDYIEQGN